MERKTNYKKKPILLLSVLICLYLFTQFTVPVFALGGISRAEQFEDGLAAIVYEAFNQEFAGYIDTNGSVKYTFNEKIETSSEHFHNFENGYTLLYFGDMCYVMNTQGQVLSKYSAEDVVAYGYGYTWVATDVSTDDHECYEYTLYDPNGNKETWFTHDTFSKIMIHYLGKGCFAYLPVDNESIMLDPSYPSLKKYCLYFTETHTLKENCISFHYIDDIRFIENRLLFYMGLLEDQKYHLVIYDPEGNCNDIIVPDEFIDSDEPDKKVNFIPRLHGQTDRYLFFEAKGKFHYLYDMDSGIFSRIITEYDEYILFDDRVFPSVPRMDNERIMFLLLGIDKRKYYILYDIDSQKPIGVPVLCDDCFYQEGILAVQSKYENGEWISVLYDEQMSEILRLYNSTIIDIKDNIIRTCVNMNGFRVYDYYNRDGELLFDTINGQNAEMLTISR